MAMAYTDYHSTGNPGIRTSDRLTVSYSLCNTKIRAVEWMGTEYPGTAMMESL